MEAGREAGLLRQWFLTINSGREMEVWSNPLPTGYRLKPGDMVMLDGGYICRGYHTDFIRWGCVGSPSAEEQRLHRLVLAGAEAARGTIKAGVSCATVFRAAQEVFLQAGVEEQIVDSLRGFGHGVGLHVREGPYIEPDEMTELQPGMVMAVEPWLPNLANPNQGPDLFAIEDMVVVTEEGYELLTPLKRELWVS